MQKDIKDIQRNISTLSLVFLREMLDKHREATKITCREDCFCWELERKIIIAEKRME